jgi:hypothetical protein
VQILAIYITEENEPLTLTCRTGMLVVELPLFEEAIYRELKKLEL